MAETAQSLDLEIDRVTGWIAGVRRVESPNCNERPAGCRPELIVVHAISLPPGEFGGPWVERFFQNDLPADEHPYFREIGHLRVSAHALIRRTGEMIQFVPFLRRAWHAGESEHCGRRECNDFSVGIELEGTDDTPFEEIQYQRLAELIRGLREAYASLGDADIVGHCDIARDRKTDPGPFFDWRRLEREIAELEG
jgi:AmpD protein